MKKIVITGANGFIGSFLLKKLSQNNNYKILALVHRMPKQILNNIEYSIYEMGKTTKQELNNLIDNYDVIIHCAWQPYINKKSNDININSVETIADICQKKNIKQLIYLSSMSAHNEAISNYGKTKYICEQLLAGYPFVTTIKPGLVIGNGGLFENICKLIKKSFVIPLPEKGKQPIHTINIFNLYQTLNYSIEYGITGTYLACEPKPVTIYSLYKEIAYLLNKKIFILNTNYNLMNIIISLSNSLYITKISKENLLGLKQLKDINFFLPQTPLFPFIEYDNYKISITKTLHDK